MSGVQAIGVARTEGTRERELRTKESQNLWTVLVPALSIGNMAFHKPVSLLSVYLTPPSVSSPGLHITGRSGWEVCTETCAQSVFLLEPLGKDIFLSCLEK